MLLQIHVDACNRWEELMVFAKCVHQATLLNLQPKYAHLTVELMKFNKMENVFVNQDSDEIRMANVPIAQLLQEAF